MEFLLFLYTVVHNFINKNQIQLQVTRDNSSIYVHNYQTLRNSEQKRRS
jgi:hypothetical protein